MLLLVEREYSMINTMLTDLWTWLFIAVLNFSTFLFDSLSSLSFCRNKTQLLVVFRGHQPWYIASSKDIYSHWKRLWCWEGLGAGGEGDNRGWDGQMASLTRWKWVWLNFRSWWWTGRPGVLRFMGLRRVGHDWATELNWTELILYVESSEVLMDFLPFKIIPYVKINCYPS